jgi:hypothetical protein
MRGKSPVPEFLSRTENRLVPAFRVILTKKNQKGGKTEKSCPLLYFVKIYSTIL